MATHWSRHVKVKLSKGQGQGADLEHVPIYTQRENPENSVLYKGKCLCVPEFSVYHSGYGTIRSYALY